MDRFRALNVIGAFGMALADRIGLAADTASEEQGPAAGAIVLIGHDPGISIRALSAGVRLTHAGTVRLIDRLAADDLVERRAPALDRRERALFLTAAGQQRCRSILAAREDALTRILDTLTAEELAVLEGIGDRLLQATVRDVGTAYRTCRLCDYARCSDCPVDAALRTTAAG